MSRFQPKKIIWEHSGERHCRDGTILPDYWAWREKGFKNDYAVRYPNGFKGRSECLFSLWPRTDEPMIYDRLDYITARKKIYCGEYIRLAPRTPHFKKLKDLLESGQSLLIVEVDGPDPTFYGLECPGLLINETTIKMLINDPRKPFGHGYVIAALLLGGETWMK